MAEVTLLEGRRDRGVGDAGGAQQFEHAVDGDAPDKISIAAVVRALDDDSALVECFRPDTKQCVISPACALQGALRSAQAAFYAELDPLTLGALVQGRAASKLRALTGD